MRNKGRSAVFPLLMGMGIACLITACSEQKQAEKLPSNSEPGKTQNLAVDRLSVNDLNPNWPGPPPPPESILQTKSVPIYREVPARTEPREVQLRNGTAVVFPNIQMHPNPTVTQTEMTIATHPTNPDIVLAGSNATPVGVLNGSQGWYYTTDGGVSWKGGDTLPTHTDFSKDMTDPTVGIDLDGNLFFSSLYTLNFNVVARSTDNGASWSEDTIPTALLQTDKPHFIADLNPNSPFKNYLYTAYTDFNLSNEPIKFARSTNGGANFSTPLIISGTVGSKRSVGANLAVGPSDEIYTAWSAFHFTPPDSIGLGFNKSTNGGTTWRIPREIRRIKNIPGTLTKGGNRIRVNSLPSMAVDRSNGSRRGWVYMVYDERSPTTPDIFLIRSTDGGNSWSAPKKLNQDEGGNDQWFPWISVDPATGHLYVVYYDSRNFPANDSAQVYISWSPDGGETFEDVLVSDIPFLPASVRPDIPSVTYSGDYIGIAALNGVVWPCWNDNRTGMHQAYTSRIVFVESGAPPKISLLPDSIDFGEVLIGRPETLSVSILNMAYPETLHVTDVQSSSPDLTPLTSTLSVPGAGSQKLKIVFKPTATGPLNSILSLTSNDPRNPVITANVLGNGICQFLGDMNADQILTATDVVLHLNCTFLGAGNCFTCFSDVNCDGILSSSDVMLELNAVFLGDSFPCP